MRTQGAWVNYHITELTHFELSDVLTHSQVHRNTYPGQASASYTTSSIYATFAADPRSQQITNHGTDGSSIKMRGHTADRSGTKSSHHQPNENTRTTQRASLHNRTKKTVKY